MVISGPRDLLALMTFSVFANRVGMAPIVAVVQMLLDSAPSCEYPQREKAERA